MCELIGRVDADPDVLPRTENFGVDYIAFSAMCPTCPPEFLKMAYNCVKVSYLIRTFIRSSDKVERMRNSLNATIGLVTFSKFSSINASLGVVEVPTFSAKEHVFMHFTMQRVGLKR